MSRTPDVTVAAVTERAGRFLVVEERVRQRLVFNQPAGHVEHGETLLAAVVREVREETAWRFEPKALLLKDAGHDVQGLFMSNWEEDDDGYCTAAQDYQDARAVAAELGIALHRASFARQYREQVFGEFLREHRAGRTPNPDVLCNREIKFGVALEWAQRLGASHFATGHYARLEPSPEGGALYKARDDAKDQSYFLHAVSRAQLSRTLMPLGELEKSAVRERARRSGLPVFDKPDSPGICFIGEP